MAHVNKVYSEYKIRKMLRGLRFHGDKVSSRGLLGCDAVYSDVVCYMSRRSATFISKVCVFHV
jgi:hypothetical protein